MDEKKKLYRLDEGKMIAGVCAGIAEYFGLDATIVRLGWVFLSIFTGCGILAYIIAVIIIPKKSNSIEIDKNQ